MTTDELHLVDLSDDHVLADYEYAKLVPVDKLAVDIVLDMSGIELDEWDIMETMSAKGISKRIQSVRNAAIEECQIVVYSQLASAFHSKTRQRYHRDGVWACIRAIRALASESEE